MLEIIDLSQEIFTGMPVFPGLPEVNISVHQSFEQLDGITDHSVYLGRLIHQPVIAQ